jgi:hypothetical protein
MAKVLHTLFANNTNMLLNSFCMGHFKPMNESQIALLEDIKTIRNIKGTPDKFHIRKALAKTKQFVKTVYPPGWKLEMECF